MCSRVSGKGATAWVHRVCTCTTLEAHPYNTSPSAAIIVTPPRERADPVGPRHAGRAATKRFSQDGCLVAACHMATECCCMQPRGVDMHSTLPEACVS